ncbi:MAG: hypothetical protein OHK0022_55350 [Roseiflexaceae bacterium]
MINPKLVGIFSCQCKDPANNDVLITIEISIEENYVRRPGKRKPVEVDREDIAAPPLIICQTGDIIYFKVSSTSKIYFPWIKELQKLSGDDVLSLSGSPGRLWIAKTEKPGFERFRIECCWNSDFNPPSKSFIVDPYISCN